MKWHPHIMAALFLISSAMNAQDVSVGQKVADYLESLALYDVETGLVSDLTEEIDALSENPVNINEASEQELSRLFFLTLFQVQNLAGYIRTRGSIISVSEIAYIPGFDRKLAELMAPFIIIKDSNQKNIKKGTGGRILLNMITRNTYLDSTAIGSPVRILTRANLRSGNTTIGFTMEKDQGELLFGNGQGPDFISGYISAMNSGFINNVILGDMRVRFGQGLVTWTGYSAGTTPLDPGLMKSMASIGPYTSSDENNFFRGAAITAGSGGHTIHAFISGNNIDATTGRAVDTGRIAIISFYDQGLHNSNSTIASKDAVVEYSGGIYYGLNLKQSHAGFTVAGTHFSIPVWVSENSEDIFDFGGQSNISIAADHAFSFRNSYFYGEEAWNPGGGFAVLEGVKLTPSTGTTFNILYTNVMKGYNSFHGLANGKETVNNFGESLLANFSFEPGRNIYVVTGVLWKRDHWYGRYGTPPVSSWRYEADTRYTPSEKLTFNLGFKHRITSDFSSDLRGLKQTRQQAYSNIRMNVSLMPAERFLLQARLEFIYSSLSPEPGYLVYTGFKYSLNRIPLSVYARVYAWSTPGYDSRIYAWEDDLLYSGPILPYYYNGNRSYLVLSYGSGTRLSCRLKAGFSSRVNNENIVSYGNEIKLQVIFKI